MFPVYGLAEVTLAATFPDLGTHPHTEVVDADILAEGHAAPCRAGRRPREVVGLGWAVPGIEVRVAHEGRTVEDNRVGEVQVRGAPVTRGYYRNHEATAAAFDADWLRTGDLGFVRAQNLFICGRRKDLIIVNGIKYHPEDVEEVVRRAPGVHRGRCVAVPLTDGPEERIGVIIETRGADAELSTAIRARVAAEIGLTRVEVVLVRPGGIPRTTSGKVMRSRVREELTTARTSEEQEHAQL
jgi:acyl-CoA synthetase (AMP-forming)/AMP-acid ligase II